MQTRKAVYQILISFAIAFFFAGSVLSQSQPLPASGQNGHFQVGINRSELDPNPNLGSIITINVVVQPAIAREDLLIAYNSNGELEETQGSLTTIDQNQSRRTILTPFETQTAVFGLRSKRLVPIEVLECPNPNLNNRFGVTIVDFLFPRGNGTFQTRTFLTNALHPIISDILIFQNSATGNRYFAFVSGDRTAGTCYLDVFRSDIPMQLPVRITPPPPGGLQVIGPPHPRSGNPPQGVPGTNFFAELATEIAVDPSGTYIYVPMRFSVEIFQLDPINDVVQSLPLSITIPATSDYFVTNIKTGLSGEFPNVIGASFFSQYNYNLQIGGQYRRASNAVFFSTDGSSFASVELGDNPNPVPTYPGGPQPIWEILPNQIAAGYRNIQTVSDGGSPPVDSVLLLCRCPDYPGANDPPNYGNGRDGVLLTVPSSIPLGVDSTLTITCPVIPPDPTRRGEPFGGIDMALIKDEFEQTIQGKLLAFHCFVNPDYSFFGPFYLWLVECDPGLGPGIAFNGPGLVAPTAVSIADAFVFCNTLDRPLFNCMGDLVTTTTDGFNTGLRSYCTYRGSRGNPSIWTPFGNINPFSPPNPFFDPYNHLGSAGPPIVGSRLTNVQGVYFQGDTDIVKEKPSSPPLPVEYGWCQQHDTYRNITIQSPYPRLPDPTLPNPFVFVGNTVLPEGPPRLTVFTGVSSFDPDGGSGACAAFGSNTNVDGFPHIIFMYICDTFWSRSWTDFQIPNREGARIETEIYAF